MDQISWIHFNSNSGLFHFLIFFPYSSIMSLEQKQIASMFQFHNAPNSALSIPYCTFTYILKEFQLYPGKLFSVSNANLGSFSFDKETTFGNSKVAQSNHFNFESESLFSLYNCRNFFFFFSFIELIVIVTMVFFCSLNFSICFGVDRCFMLSSYSNSIAHTSLT